ncbi:MAG: HAD hydrolase-like protein, partial [Methylovulum sp.]|nr:HAD hydrolase-like protein [Methylovulum sp.]
MIAPSLSILDCDGVVLDSNTMKIAAFRTALAAYPKSVVARFSDYQARNFGRSRYVLFKDFFNFLEREPEAGEIDGLLDRYAVIVRSAYLDAPLTPGCLETLAHLAAFGPVYIASGSDQTELRWVMQQRSLTGYFTGIYGSPQSKTDILASLAPAAGERALFIGDAKADLEAAQRHHWCDFVYMRHFSTATAEMDPLIQQAGL